MWFSMLYRMVFVLFSSVPYIVRYRTFSGPKGVKEGEAARNEGWENENFRNFDQLKF